MREIVMSRAKYCIAECCADKTWGGRQVDGSTSRVKINSNFPKNSLLII